MALVLIEVRALPQLHENLGALNNTEFTAQEIAEIVEASAGGL
ncbi:hypothetical protein [Pelagibacterium lentulum]|nr:hypothetical protein [Pelagibacterium lentulum]